MFEAKLVLSHRLVRIVAAIDRFRGRWEVTAPMAGARLPALRKEALTQSVGASLRLDDGKTEEADAVGYREALKWILDRFRTIPFQESTLLQLHEVLLTHAGRPRGRYKTEPNPVTAEFSDGTRRVLFQPASPAETPVQMGALLTWTRDQLAHKDVHPLLAISLFVYEFACIRPFQDGNGRMVRLLTAWLLLRSGYSFIQFVSFEQALERRRKEYFRAFMACHARRGGEETLGEWQDFFLGTLLELSNSLEKSFAAKKAKGDYLSETHKRLLAAAEGDAPFKFSDARKKLPDVNENTLKKALQGLVKTGRLEKMGEKKGAIYILSRQPSR